MNVYGTKMAGEVKLEGPCDTRHRQPPPADVYEVDTRLAPGTKKQVETAHAGLTTVITRRIITAGQPDKVDQFTQHLQALAELVHRRLAVADPSGSTVSPITDVNSRSIDMAPIAHLTAAGAMNLKEQRYEQ